jgi:signal transduction histidine kinase
MAGIHSMRFVHELRSHLQYKIILPFLLLTLLVALAGSAVSFLLITGSAQDRLNNQLAQVARATSDALVNQERANLVFLREVAFAGPNERTGAPALADALASDNVEGLSKALDPYFRAGAQRPGVRADRLIVFDTSRHSVIDWELARDASGAASRVERDPRDIGALWFVPQILAGQQDQLGDKFAGLLDLADSDTRYLFTVAPVLKGDQVVGGLIIAARLDTILQTLSASSQAAMVTLYRAEDGGAFASTTSPADGLSALNMRGDLVGPTRDLKLAEQQSIFDTVRINERDYQFAYAPLRVRNNLIGMVSVGLARDYVTGPLADAGPPLTALTIGLMLAIIGLGVFIARQITRPLQELVDTAQAVTAGDLERRSRITVEDEIGILSDSFNGMTAHLLDLYRAVHAEASQRAAIVESITDGVVVCDPSGAVLVINRATRVLLGLADDAPGPSRFEEIPITPLGDATPSFGEARALDLFNLGEHIVRVAAAPVQGDDGVRIGDVYVLQDMTSEVAMDRAKTNFIATISHELRTPLTVLGGSSELLLRGMVGPLADEQRALIEGMRKHTLSMTSVLNNVITIAGLESGSLTFDIEPIALGSLLNDMLWSIRPQIAAKGLSLKIDVAEGLPNVLADAHQLRGVLHQLLDNARRYTDAGSITIRAADAGDRVRVDISDTGHGIGPDLNEHLFTRFTRGSDGINSAERGIGLGLAIARQLIERQGGTLWLDSTSEQGSTFSFTLPCIHEDTHHNESAIATAA